MSDKIHQHPKAREKQGKDAIKEFAETMDRLRRERKRRNILARIAGWSFLLFIATASISGAVWAVVSLVRFVWGAA